MNTNKKQIKEFKEVRFFKNTLDFQNTFEISYSCAIRLLYKLNGIKEIYTIVADINGNDS